MGRDRRKVCSLCKIHKMARYKLFREGDKDELLQAQVGLYECRRSVVCPLECKYPTREEMHSMVECYIHDKKAYKYFQDMDKDFFLAVHAGHEAIEKLMEDNKMPYSHVLEVIKHHSTIRRRPKSFWNTSKMIPKLT